LHGTKSSHKVDITAFPPISTKLLSNLLLRKKYTKPRMVVFPQGAAVIEASQNITSDIDVPSQLRIP